jgi:formylglycine-generating enzyme required for sulfatase activity
MIEGGEIGLKIDQTKESGLVSRLKRLVSTEDQDGSRPFQNVDSFWMARYPVTISQFEAFVQDCFREGAWHLPDGVPSTGLEEPSERSAKARNEPVTDVSWYEAIAFCHWLSERLGVEVRLPTEFEWQLAATGGDPGNVYPWGVDWDAARANIHESGLNRKTAVGLYARGATKQGVMDMAGTVWEWCANDYEDPASTAFPKDSSTDRRVLRGGSWRHLQFNARCAARFRNAPSKRNYFVGFRVVCSSPILGTVP